VVIDNMIKSDRERGLSNKLLKFTVSGRNRITSFRQPWASTCPKEDEKTAPMPLTVDLAVSYLIRD